MKRGEATEVSAPMEPLTEVIITHENYWREFNQTEMC